ncbi:Phage major capsid protein, HK97 family [Tepidanaerobacter acetatoxydans Re1]|uniref:Phage major capsid protein, HK97 family n=1 Tax=Tepidanaerobacter acetatoxydans (strain DSM 21804 / JCM 16047 / Re1) TaxID=1209989 RepID=F4LTS6_TEPAE|nr:phage major capsid protein [Tepidanaerobacter acetatoxydans]AEE92523.1 phage major capsid protein, HK97 family [Tepidanaerobacter acetatoxydans Re1]CCP27471.1 Phage major capsid protein, HK97 family [Tepidanaerobacter acetatoxydans Re1]
MSKKLRELLQALETEKAKVRGLLKEDKVLDAEKAMEKVRSLQKEVALQQELEALEDQTLDDATPIDHTRNRTDAELEAEYKRVFLKGLRRQRITADDHSIINEYRAAMHEGGVTGDSDGDTGIIVPQDIQTRINELMRTLNDLSKYIRVETVNTLSGSRVLEKDEDMVPFAVVDEYGEIQEIDNPKFTPVTYKLIKRAGFLPLTNELLKDTDQNILSYVTNWIAKKHVVTKNSLIIAILNSLNKKGLTDIKAIKKVLNVDLDPAISLSSTIITNQDGFQWLDEQEDANNRPLLQDDITQPGKKLFKGRPIVVVANRTLPSTGTTTVKAPFIVGNFKELMVLFSRGVYELASTNIGGDAWRRDSTELRTITRDDCVKWDSEAAVYGQLTISSGA